MSLNYIRLKKGEDRRIRAGHPWIFSNEIDTGTTPLKNFTAGEQVNVQAHDQTVLGTAYLNPHSLIAGRMISRLANHPLTLDFFITQLKQALHLRETLFDQPYYRLVLSESDGLPGLVIDRFGDDIVVQINTVGMEAHRELIITALKTVFPHLHAILWRNDSPIREQEGLPLYVEAAFGDVPNEIELIENNVKFNASLLHGQKTGWFYDHRLNRARLAAYVQGKRVLDVFSYLGGWGIQAAVLGAASVECIDASSSACEFIEKNARLNHVEQKVKVSCEDAFDALKARLQASEQYDVIVLDPPAFVKRFKDRKEGLLAYQRLNEMAVKLLVPGGILFSCSCSMHVSMDDLVQLLQRVSYRTQTTLQILERGHQAPDHPVHLMIPETDYLKALVVRKQ